MANSPGAQELMTFASGPALVKWPQHLQQEHGDCQRKFGLISSSAAPPPHPLPPFTTAATLPPFYSLSLFPFPSHFALKFVNLSGFLFFFLSKQGHPQPQSRTPPITEAGQEFIPLTVAISPPSLPVPHLSGRR